MSNAKQILMDLSTELQGQILSDVFTINGRKYEMQLLTDAETAWVYSHIKASNPVLLSMTSRTSTLSAGIRKINGCTIDAMFEDMINEINLKREKLSSDYEKLDKSEIKDLSDFVNPYEGLTGKYLSCKLLFDWLGAQPSPYIDLLYKSWKVLNERQLEMQASVKKSLQGSSESPTEKNLTGSSLDGEESTQE